ncbi:MAG: helix-turn-helix domain-containing protein [Firmicutes bacterium]|nr:helix-turn-helix domain-containing protein [Bacillota bacterium]
MREIGEFLRNAREAKGMTLEDVEQVTRIRRKYLEAIENGDASEMPGEVQLKGFIRNYAVAVGLDPAAVIRRYLESRGAETPVDDGALGGRKTEILVVEARKPRKLLIAVVAALLLVVAAAVLYYFLVYKAQPAAGSLSTLPAEPLLQVSGLHEPVSPQ